MERIDERRKGKRFLVSVSAAAIARAAKAVVRFIRGKRDERKEK